MAIRDIFKGVSSGIRKRFIDTFNRANQSGLGTASDGSLWTVIRGSWSISSNAAVGADANYPMATVTMPTQNNQINIVSSVQGSAAALWVTDSGNWWAVGMTQEPESCNCTYYYNTNYYYYTTNCVGYTAGTWNGSNCNGNISAGCIGGYANTCNGSYNASNCNNYACNGYTCNAYNAYNAKNKTGGTCAASSCAGYRCSGSWNVSTCNGTITSFCTYGPYSTCNGNYNNSTQNADTPYYYACNQLGSSSSGPFASCSTCYPQYIRVLQSVANTVSVVTQWSIGATLAAAFRVKTSGTQITTSVYSDSTATTQIGSDLVYTPTGITITPTYGITVIPSSYSQGYSIDSVEITRN